MDMEYKDLKTHIQEHIHKWPATKDEIAEACNKMDDVSDEERMLFNDKLPDGTYNSPDEVLMALGMKEEKMEEEEMGEKGGMGEMDEDKGKKDYWE